MFYYLRLIILFYKEKINHLIFILFLILFLSICNHVYGLKYTNVITVNLSNNVKTIFLNKNKINKLAYFLDNTCVDFFQYKKIQYLRTDKPNTFKVFEKKNIKDLNKDFNNFLIDKIKTVTEINSVIKRKNNLSEQTIAKIDDHLLFLKQILSLDSIAFLNYDKVYLISKKKKLFIYILIFLNFALYPIFMTEIKKSKLFFSSKKKVN